MSSEINKCPKCGSTEIGKGRLQGYASMYVIGRLFSSSNMTADVCSDCGYVIQIKVDKPYKFKNK